MPDTLQLLNFLLEHMPMLNGEFTVTENEDAMGVTYRVKVSSSAMPGLIGRGGKNIKALRDVLLILARNGGRKVFLKLED